MIRLTWIFGFWGDVVVPGEGNRVVFLFQLRNGSVYRWATSNAAKGGRDQASRIAEIRIEEVGHVNHNRIQSKVRSDPPISAVAKASVSMRVFEFGAHSYRRRGSGLGFLLRKMRQTLLLECHSISSNSHTDCRRLPLNYRSCCRLTHKLAGTPVASDRLLMDLDSV